MNVSDLFGQSPTERNAAMRGTGNPTHCGPTDWDADIAQSTRRAFASLAAMKHGQPRPTWGRHNAGANK